jgi:hypothetical protein
VASLNAGSRPKPFCFGFLHSEPEDVIAIDQKGHGRNLAETRLYVYPDTESETLYLLTVGDKPSQGDDIENCKRFVHQIKHSTNVPGDRTDDSGEQAEGG